MAAYKTFIPAAWAEFTAKCKALFPFLKKTFVGTRAEWDVLSTAEKIKYDVCDLVDDVAGGEMLISDEVAAGDLNPVTSNAVAEAIEPLGATAFKTTLGGANFDSVRLALGLTYPAVFKFEAIGSHTTKLYGTGVMYRESESTAPTIRGYLTEGFTINSNNMGTFQLYSGETAIGDAAIICTKVR